MKRWNRKEILLPAVLVIMISACAKVHPVSKDIVREDNLQVMLLEERDSSNKVVPRGFDHPWDVDITTLHKLLASINYQKGILFYKNKAQRAFPEEELKFLLPYLQKAFASAGPDQYVDFSFTQIKTWTILQRRYLTDGLLFRKGDTLHCAFRNIAYEERGGTEGSSGPYVQDPTSKPVPADWSFVLTEGQTLEYVERPGLLGSKTYPNWIKLDIPVLLQHAPAEGVKQEQPKALATPPESAKGAVIQSRKEIEEKLRFLEELHKQGLIAPASYEEKRKELLHALETLPPSP